MARIPKRALVTGASRGIGRSTAERLAADGWKIAVHYAHDREAADELIDQLGAQAAGLYRADLSNPAEATRLAETVIRDAPLDAVVNNAGIYLQNSFLDSGQEEFDATLRRTMAVNFESPLRIARTACRHYRDRGAGKIVNVASRVGFRGEAGAALYAASKSALINLTRSLAVELAETNIQVFGIAPGWVETAMARQGMEERLAAILRDIPLGRVAKPEDCANVVAFLLSDQAEYLSGVTIDINGASYFH